MPAMTYPRTVSHPVPAPPRRKMPRWQIAVLAGITALILAGGAALAYLLVSDRVGAFSAVGTVQLRTGQFAWYKSTATCEGYQAYSDIREGADVSIADATGKTVALGRLQAGAPDGVSEDQSRASSCSLSFTVTGVPRGVGPYAVWVTRHGPKHYTEAELDGHTLTLGFG